MILQQDLKRAKIFFDRILKHAKIILKRMLKNAKIILDSAKMFLAC